MNGSVAGGGGFSEEVISLTRRPSGIPAGPRCFPGRAAAPRLRSPRRGGEAGAGARGWWWGLPGGLSGRRAAGGRVSGARAPAPARQPRGSRPQGPPLPRRALEMARGGYAAAGKAGDLREGELAGSGFVCGENSGQEHPLWL